VAFRHRAGALAVPAVLALLAAGALTACSPGAIAAAAPSWAITVGSSARYLSRVNFEPLPAVAQAVSRTLIAKIGG